MNLILAIDTSCDETSVAVTCGRRVLSNIISSQINIHKKYGGVYPALAKRAHEERIDAVVEETLRRAWRILGCGWEVRSESRSRDVKCVKKPYYPPPLPTPDSQLTSHPHFPISAVAVTQGPGLAIALEVGIRKAKELVNGYGWEVGSGSGSESEKWVKKTYHPPSFLTLDSQLISHPHPKLISVNHLEGHIYSCLAQNSAGKPEREIAFPALCLLVSGGHTELVLMKNHGKYQVLGQTLDDACGEALDKAAKILHLGYPGGPIIERLAEQSNNETMKQCNNVISKYHLSSPMTEKTNLNFSYSGLKTQFLYLVENMSEKELGQNLHQLSFTFQEAAFEQLIRKTSQAIAMYQPKTLLCGGGVIANKYLRKLLRKLARKNNLPILFPPQKNLITDNAAMIGVAAYYKYQRKEFVNNPETLDREPRLSL